MIVRARAYKEREVEKHNLKLDRERWAQSRTDSIASTAQAPLSTIVVRPIAVRIPVPVLSALKPADSDRSRWTIEVQLDTGVVEKSMPV